MATVLSLSPVHRATAPSLPALKSARPAPRAIAGLLRLAVIGVLVYLWARILGGGFTEALRYLQGELGSRAAALAGDLAGVLFLFSTTLRVALWLRYRPAPLPETMDGELPTVTAIVPAYNEGAMVRHALLSLVGSDYPQDKLQIVAIDDGSVDDTYEHMQAAARLAPGRILLLRQPRNRGKRAALQAGFAAARSEIVLTADSDCVLAPDAVRQMVAPFANPRVGAVAGRVVIHNQKASWITRLLGPQFTLTFDFMRAAQSVNGTVLCCPGALSAFRLSVVRRVLPAWLDQRFFGVRVGPGEDRFLTTLVLREGYLSKYQSTARVHTLVPARYGKICKMFLRWDRCDLRESLEALWLWPRRMGLGRLSVLPYLCFAFETLLTVPTTTVAVGTIAATLVLHPVAGLATLAGANVLTGMSLMLCLTSDFSPETLFMVGYSWFWPAVSWIMPYAAFTLRDQAWMSRDQPITVRPAASASVAA